MNYPNKIPKHWQVKKLGEICEILDNKRKPINSSEREMRLNLSTQRFPYFGATGQVGFIDDYIFDFEAILLGEDGAPFLDSFKKKAYIVSGKYWVNNHAHILKAINGISTNHFVCYFLNSINYAPYVSGTTRLKLNQESMKNIEILLPPLDEQNLIVKNIESCFKKIDFAISNFKKSKELIEIYKQSVLSHAFNGKLTNSNLNSWQVKKLCDNSDIMTGSTPPKNEPKFYGNEYPFFKPTDLNDGYLVKFARDNLSEAGKQISRQLPPKSVLVACIGATIGKTGLIRVEGSCNQQINAIVPKENLLPEYVYFYVISAQFQNLILENASSTTLPILNKSKFEALPILLPPLSEQNLIVAQIEKCFKAADNALNLIEQNLKKAEILKQSILSKAFNGELIKDKNE
ncbi:restriction endonuclease subunit S [Campylobacter concisus]|uniref:restriction endonuclease subunit S n=1 Tax=Campylobacter concisus TaxID=199 RepID=UPI0018840E9B|nr:restriction endonuclease subunit S [Campylobacter concisus]MBE9817548.1 hypothetical protein [Campylobacter concisus]